MSETIYKMVTDRIIEQLEKGVVPWRRPWKNGTPVNWVTQRPYRGINSLLLGLGEYATFKQIGEAGGKVRKGEKGQIVVFWKWIERENEESGEKEQIPFLRYYKVFNVIKQAEGLKSRRETETFDHDPIESAQQIVDGYVDAPSIHYKSGRAVYYPELDHISVPPLKDYREAEEYYSVLFHELIHSTGHKTRLARKGITQGGVSFGDEVYSKEELVAEIGAAMLCGVAGIENVTIENSASYIQSWLRVLREDSKLIMYASAQAQKAGDYIYSLKE
ncbi:ArdC family protein [Domibacillus robiginosus]|uniref:ArdC family protein n=1 Tax=Domibacillus robiginosus TaxID=1071054 RepID=UPI00067D2871|nr:zincin-like metallopeptidase domain-containing protein [Domibacillus robiginosus]